MSRRGRVAGTAGKRPRASRRASLVSKSAAEIAAWIARLGDPGTDAIIAFCEEQFSDLGPLYPVPLVAALARAIAEHELDFDTTVAILRVSVDSYSDRPAYPTRWRAAGGGFN